MIISTILFSFFFFQAEDGIRDKLVTGVQTCALPILILVGDSLGMVVLGHENTLSVTLDEMLHHTRAVRRGTRRALVVADMPYGSYHTDLANSLHNAMRFVKEAGAEAVKVEGGERRLELISRLTEAEIPLIGHVG